MRELLDHVFVEFGGRFVAGNATARGKEKGKLEVNVVFTHTQGTLAALKAAGMLTRGLDARINLMAPHVVPWALPLTHPPVSVPFARRRLLDLVRRGAQGEVEIAVRLYLCRDRRRALLEVLKPKSVVVMSGRRWWPTWEAKLSRTLRARGHHVILVKPE